ncbi:MAG: XkdX family protein [Eubacterium sp.]|nr:XkdX family protein [Eubacterium sp.]MBQ4458009.1 XkdX family protein [Clostridia bacterium]
MAKKKAKSEPVEHSPKFELVKSYYDAGLWKKKAVKNAVVKGWITAAEYEEITGEQYE